MRYAAPLLLSILTLTGCPFPRVSGMIAPLGDLTIKQTDKIFSVGEVTGGEKTVILVSGPKIDNEGFGEALTKTLEQSGLFKAVVRNKSGDYELNAQIISQEVQIRGGYHAILFVNYRLLDSRLNQEIWKENILSQYDANSLELATGANEGAVRDNLTQLVKKLSQVLSR